MAFLVGMFEALCFVLGFGYISHGQSWRTEIRIIVCCRIILPG